MKKSISPKSALSILNEKKDTRKQQVDYRNIQAFKRKRTLEFDLKNLRSPVRSKQTLKQDSSNYPELSSKEQLPVLLQEEMKNFNKYLSDKLT